MYSLASTESYIRVGRRKIYLDVTYAELHKKINDDSNVIVVEVSEMLGIGKKKTFIKSNISEYGEAGL